MIYGFKIILHEDLAVETDISQQKSPGFNFWFGPGAILCEVCMFSLCLLGFSPVPPAD